MYPKSRHPRLLSFQKKQGHTSPTWTLADLFRSRKLRVVLLLLVLFFIFLNTTFNSSSFRPRFREFYEQHHHKVSNPLPLQITEIQWTDFAYTQYVTNPNYLCNSVMIFESLERLKSKADRVMMYPQEWTVPEDDGANSTYESKLLAEARDLYNVKLVPIKVLSFSEQEKTWADSFTKLLAFNQTQYKRVVNVDSDSTIVQNMDELFFLPPTPVAMPRAYWLEDNPNFLSSQLLVIAPSEFEFARIESAISNHTSTDFDMEIVNDLYGHSCLMLPHRQYDMITGELRKEDHTRFLGSAEAQWNVTTVMQDAKFVHFSDWPFPKPWIKASERQWEDTLPKSEKEGEIWRGLYKDFSERRKRICGRAYDM